MAILPLALCLGLLAAPNVRAGGMRLGDICRLKGQELNSLQGLGLVVGLRGTGDPDARPTAAALARMMQLMGGQMSVDIRGQLQLDDVEAAKNVALVFVTATIPEVGAQQGDRVDVRVNAISAKSLEGGYLMLTPLLGPRADNPTVYAMAEGPLQISDDGSPTSAGIKGGGKMEATVTTSFQHDGKITLILDPDFAAFDIAQRIETAINDMGEVVDFAGSSDPNSSARATQAQAIDQLHVEVMIPPLYRSSPIKFISLILDVVVDLPEYSSRVVINEQEGVVVIGEDVEIAPVLITHRDLRIEATAGQSPLVPLDPSQPATGNAKLKSLADALNALDVPTADLIAIIKTLKRKGDLYGEVVFQ